MNLLRFIELQNRNTVLHRVPLPIKGLLPIITIVCWAIYENPLYPILILFLVGFLGFMALGELRYPIDIFVAFSLLYLTILPYYLWLGRNPISVIKEKLPWFLFLLALAMNIALFMASTSSEQFEGFLRKMRLPNSLVMMLVISYNLIPTIYREVEQIIMNQKARGLEFSRNPLVRLKQLLAIYIPAIFSAIVRIDSLKEAFLVRGYS